MRVYELARDLKATNEWLLEFLINNGINVKSHMSNLDDESVQKFRQALFVNPDIEARVKPTVIRRRKKKVPVEVVDENIAPKNDDQRRKLIDNAGRIEMFRKKYGKFKTKHPTGESHSERKKLADLSIEIKVPIDELQDQKKQLKKLGLFSEDEKGSLSAETIEILSTINNNTTVKGLSELCNVSKEEIIDQLFMLNGLTIRSDDQKVEISKLFDVLAQIKRNPIKGKKLIIDGMNICYLDESGFSLKCLLSLLLVIIEREGEFECIFDSTVKKRFKEKNPNEWRYIDKLRCEVGEFFRVCPSGEEADRLILKLSGKKHNLIISNDNYDDYKPDFKWVGRGSPRLKKVKITEDDEDEKKFIQIKDLLIRTKVREDLDAMVYEIIAKLK